MVWVVHNKKIVSIGDSHNCASIGSLVLPLKVRGHTILNPINILPLMYVTSYWLARWPPLLEPWPGKIPTSDSSWGLFPPMVLLEVVQPRIFLLQSLHKLGSLYLYPFLDRRLFPFSTSSSTSSRRHGSKSTHNFFLSLLFLT